MNPVYILDAVRTPIGRVGGIFKSSEVQDLLAPLITALLQRNEIKPHQVDEVIVGNAAGPGGNPARVALLAAGLPFSVPGVSIDRQCGSGLEAINVGARLIQSGAATLVVAGGVESASTAPLRARAVTSVSETVSLQSRQLPAGWEFYRRARFTPQGIEDPEMGMAAENVAIEYAVSRQAQDDYALESHRRAVAAEQQGAFDAERVGIKVAVRIENQTFSETVIRDESPRANSTAAKLAALQPVFKPQGTVTAGNACPINDGASLIVMSSRRQSSLHGHRVLEFVDSAAAGVEPRLLGTGPISSTRKLFRRCGLSMDDLDLVEFNEAFAAQVIACATQLQIPGHKMNPQGGALALGHPYGASGAVLVTRLFHQLLPGQTGLATLGIGGGLGLSTIFRRV